MSISKETFLDKLQVFKIFAETIADNKYRPTQNNITILIGDWKIDNSDPYPAYADIAVEELKEKDRADVIFLADHLETAESCGVSPITEISAGNIRLRAVEIPETNLTATLWITHGKGS